MAGERLAALRERLELPDRYLLFRAQYDARKDLPTLLRALRALASREGAGPSPASPAAAEADGEAAPLPWPPTVIACLPSAGPGDEAAEAHAADAASLRGLTERDGATTQFRVVPMLTRDDEAALVAGARALVHPALVEGSGLAAIDALSAGIPVVATNVGALGELVGKAGILVPPRDARRLAAAIETIWRDDRLQARLARAAAKRSAATTRTWADVARETREVYRLAAVRARA
jgi:glycosyltransferase involved in cell wall biosynthesis